MSKPDAGAPRKRRRRGSINAGDIVAGAFEVARRTSLDQLSMPVLAQHLEVGVTSIYWYFRKKDELLDAMTDVAVDEYAGLVPEVRASDTWQHTLSTHFHAQRDLHLGDDVLCDLLYIRTAAYSSQASRRLMEVLERLVAKLVADGFGPADALRVHNAVAVYTRGCIVHDRILRKANTPTVDPARQRAMADWSAMPVLDGLVDHTALSGTSDEDFAFGVDRLLCGFEDLL
ncbi:TetR/AcrR family transcriptional regulator [Amycolatopsis sp. GM8]|uniref:TetR/AcrR family transcriptional regulator n=1 Tax=Amycolatopsis sp. GM8 TaxID=2896530 RepID=UPI001EFF94DF|nr:TetR family transcriptional regulator [Amycolatopsis sp. GM8]